MFSLILTHYFYLFYIAFPYLVYGWGSTPDRSDLVLKPGRTVGTAEIQISCTGMTGDGYDLTIEVLENWESWRVKRFLVLSGQSF